MADCQSPFICPPHDHPRNDEVVASADASYLAVYTILVSDARETKEAVHSPCRQDGHLCLYIWDDSGRLHLHSTIPQVES
jgi:hypothetical protein